jgi:hypothetical protein
MCNSIVFMLNNGVFLGLEHPYSQRRGEGMSLDAQLNIDGAWREGVFVLLVFCLLSVGEVFFFSCIVCGVFVVCQDPVDVCMYGQDMQAAGCFSSGKSALVFSLVETSLLGCLCLRCCMWCHLWMPFDIPLIKAQMFIDINFRCHKTFL